MSASEFGWKSIDDILQPIAHTINVLPEGLTFSEAVPDEKDDENIDENMSCNDSSDTDDDDDYDTDEECGHDESMT